jgi:Ca2+-binding EF-hand superfamily protein
MTTELLAAKYARLFANIDQDGDGYAGLPDLQALGTRVLTAFGLSTTTGNGLEFMNALRSHWDTLVSHCQPDALGRITLEQAQQAAEEIYTPAGGYDQTAAPLVDAALGVLDSNGDGVVATAEFTKMAQAVGTPADQIPGAFEAQDQDGDGTVTVDQLRNAAREYFTSTEQNAPGNALFGQV